MGHYAADMRPEWFAPEKGKMQKALKTYQADFKDPASGLRFTVQVDAPRRRDARRALYAAFPLVDFKLERLA